MTQPDEYFPATSVNADPGFAAYAATTQGEWEAQMRGPLDAHWGPLSGVCLLLEQIPFFGDLIDMGGGPEGNVWGPIGATLEGFITLAESLCELILGSGSGPGGATTPTSILSGTGSIFTQITESPLIMGLLDLVEDTGNLIGDLINGALQFANMLCGIVSGALPDPNATTPQTIAGGLTSIFDTINNSGFLSAFIDLAQTEGTLILKFLDGFVTFLDQLWDLFVALFPGLFGKTPGEVIAGSTADNINTILQSAISALLDWIMQVPAAITAVVQGFVAWVDTWPDLAVSLVEGFIRWLEAAPSLVVSIVQAFIDLITALPEVIVNLIETAVSWISSDNSFITIVLQALIDLVAAVPEMAGAILQAVISLIEAAPEIAGALIRAFITLLSELPDIAAELIQAITGGLVDAILGAIEGVPFVGGTLAQLIGSVGGLTTTSNSAYSGLTGLIADLINIPSTVIGSLLNNSVDQNDSTLNQLLGGLFGAFSPSNTPAGAYGGSGTPGSVPPSAYGGGAAVGGSVIALYGTAQAATNTLTVAGSVGDYAAYLGAAGAPAMPWVGP